MLNLANTHAVNEVLSDPFARLEYLHDAAICRMASQDDPGTPEELAVEAGLAQWWYDRHAHALRIQQSLDLQARWTEEDGTPVIPF